MTIHVLRSTCVCWTPLYQTLLELEPAVELIDTQDLLTIRSEDVLVLPGVGNMKEFSNNVGATVGLEKLAAKIRSSNVRILAICLGFQFLCTRSEEGGGAMGLALLDYSVEQLCQPRKSNIGWGNVDIEFGNIDRIDSSIRQTLLENAFYYSHSFGIINSDLVVKCDASAFACRFGERSFISAYVSDRIVGFQFHPEKSGNAGRVLLSKTLNFLRGRINVK
jgi:glutamine amidotransferase